MRKLLLAAFGMTILLSGIYANPAAAITPATPSALGLANPQAILLERTAVICGNNGCSPVLTKRVRKFPRNFVTRAAPLVFPAANARQNSPAKN